MMRIRIVNIWHQLVPVVLILMGLAMLNVCCSYITAAPAVVNRNTELLWHFDEGSGTNVADASPHSRDGIFSPDLSADGASAWISGDTGYSNAVHFGAVASDKARKVLWTGTDMGMKNMDAFSIQIRIKPTHFTKEDRIWSFGTSIGSGTMLYVDPSLTTSQNSITNLVILWYSDGDWHNQSMNLTSPLNAGVWQDLTLIHRSNDVTNEYNQTWQIWKDNQLLSSATSANRINSDFGEAYAGSASAYTWYFNYEGNIDEFRVQGEAVYGIADPEVIPFEADDDTLLLWHFDEGFGTNIADASSHGRDGVFSPDLDDDGTDAWLASEAGFTNAVHTEGVASDENRNIQWIGSDMGLASLDAFSVQMRMKPKHFTAVDHFWSIGDSIGYCLSMQANYYLTVAKSSITQVHVYLYNSGHHGFDIDLTESLDAEVWQELTLIYRSDAVATERNGTWQVWKDGKLIGTSTNTTQISYQSDKVYVAGGESITWYRHYEGDVDEFRIQSGAVYTIPPSGTLIIIN